MRAGWARRISYLVLAALVFVTSCRAWSHAEPGADFQPIVFQPVVPEIVEIR